VTPRAAEPGRRGGAPAAHRLRHLDAVLCWGVVYAEVGASAYYVPGLLQAQLGAGAAGFVLVACAAFALLAFVQAEVAARQPRGGGVVAIASEAFGPRTGALAGILILVDCLLTAAIAALAAFTQLAAILPPLGAHVAPLALCALALLGVFAWIGIRDGAAASAVVGLSASTVLLALSGVTAWRLQPEQWSAVGGAFAQVRELPLAAVVLGFAAAWLSGSGSEALAQLSPAMAPPRARTANRAAFFVALALLATAPLLTAFALSVVDPVQVAHPHALQVELARRVGGRASRIAVALTGAALLLCAANTAIVLACHIFGALAERGFLPGGLVRRSKRFGTPAAAIATAVMLPAGAVLAARGDLAALAGAFGFGLLAAFTLSSLALARVRLAARRLGPGFALALATALLFGLAWSANLVARPRATLLGGGCTLALFVYGLGTRAPRLRRRAAAAAASREAERSSSERPSAAQILTLPEALELRPAYTPKTILCLRAPNERLLEEGLVHLRGQKEWEAALVYVDEVPGIFVPRENEPSPDAREVLAEATGWLGERGVTALPIWRLAHDAGEAIADAARQLGAETVLVGSSRRGALWRLLRGSALARLVARAPERTRIVIVS
jgi:amino acid transporter/nucleotide-binding universal stress UspA family protein